jgi:hypothetical protein
MFKYLKINFKDKIYERIKNGDHKSDIKNIYLLIFNFVVLLHKNI